ncbi:TetR/AcrR family transcriptional regulator [Nocardia asteroides]|uniref:TetR/AcrR family transcriptional regulator n=1 Tax=Nocardia asteroides TaxID=1824 RepID=UPI00366A4FD7
MARPLDHRKRAELLAGVVAYIATHGLAELSLRPLAAALGTSSRMLIYYFGTKEELLVQALATQRPDLAAVFGGVTEPAQLRDRLTAFFDLNTDGAEADSVRVLLQVLGAACAPARRIRTTPTRPSPPSSANSRPLCAARVWPTTPRWWRPCWSPDCAASSRTG